MPRFFDCHAHTCDLSYCCDEGITVSTYVEALRRSGEAAGVAITNHGFAIYFPPDLAWSWRYMARPEIWDEHREWGNRRLAAHLAEVEEARDQGLCTGIEVELMCDGRLTLDDRFRDRLSVVIGSVHVLPEQFGDQELPPEALLEAWWQHTAQLAAAGIDLLGHPFRWIAGRKGVHLDDEWVRRVVLLAKQQGIGLEINSHQVVDNDVALLRLCVEQGVPLAFGTDAHRREEILDFSYHKALLTRAGMTVDELTLWRPSGC